MNEKGAHRQNEDFQLVRETLADRMSSQLRQQILSGRLRTGQTMPTERELGEAFGVGRTTVREALQGLVHSGFLERKSNQLIVRDREQIPEHDVNYAAMAARISVEDLYETRKTLESMAVELAAKNWADNDIASLRAALDAMRDRSGAEYHSADVEFHTTIVRIGKNTVLQQVYEDSKNLFFKLPGFWRVFAPTATAGRPITGWEGHRRIVDAIEARDATAAVQINSEMLDRVKNTLIERMKARDAAGIETSTSSERPAGIAPAEQPQTDHTNAETTHLTSGGTD